MLLPLNLRDQLLDVVKTPSLLQSKFARTGMVGSGASRFLHHLQAGAERLIHHASERTVQSAGKRSRPVENVVVYGQCCSHDCIIAS